MKENKMTNNTEIQQNSQALVELCEVSNRAVFTFFDAEYSNILLEGTRALVKQKDGFMVFAVWFGETGHWIEEGSLCFSGGDDITDTVVEFALTDVNIEDLKIKGFSPLQTVIDDIVETNKKRLSR